MTTECQTGVGRIVWGHPAKSAFKTHQDGPNKGKPIINDKGEKIPVWAFGVAFPKAEFGQHTYPFMDAEVRTAFPNGAPPGFAWKYKDGDGVDKTGKPYSAREGYAGCWVLTISTEAFAPPIFKWEGNAYRQLAAEELKTGDFVSVGLALKVNVATSNTRSSSLYVNPRAIELVGYGKEILQANADPMAIFGGRQHQLPPGASLTPVASSPAGVGMPTGPQPGYAPQPPMQPQPYAPPGAPMQPQPGYAPQPPMQPPAPGYAPQPGMQPAPVPVTSGYPQPVQPAHDFIPQAGQPMQPGYPQQPPAPGYAPQPPMQPQPGYAPQQPQPGYQPQPGMPGMMPQR